MTLDPLLPWATRHPTFNLQYNFVLRNLCLEESMISIQVFWTYMTSIHKFQYKYFKPTCHQYINFQYMYWGLSKQKKGGEYILDVGGGFFFFFFILISFGRFFFGRYLTIGSLMRKIKRKLQALKLLFSQVGSWSNGWLRV